MLICSLYFVCAVPLVLSNLNLLCGMLKDVDCQALGSALGIVDTMHTSLAGVLTIWLQAPHLVRTWWELSNALHTIGHTLLSDRIESGKISLEVQ